MLNIEQNIFHTKDSLSESFQMEKILSVNKKLFELMNESMEKLTKRVTFGKWLRSTIFQDAFAFRTHSSQV